MQESVAYFPLFVNLQDKQVLVFGGGVIATRRVLTLLEFGAELIVIAPECSGTILELHEKKKLQYVESSYNAGEIGSVFLVLAATNQSEVNEKIWMECKEKGIFVNVASDHTKCDFYFPGIIKEDSLVIGVTASGTNHKLVKVMTDKIRNAISKENR